MYCGDGINDLAALAAADVGMAVGSSDASAAASVITQQNGIAGADSLPLLCRCLLKMHCCCCLVLVECAFVLGECIFVSI